MKALTALRRRRRRTRSAGKTGHGYGPVGDRVPFMPEFPHKRDTVPRPRRTLSRFAAWPTPAALAGLAGLVVLAGLALLATGCGTGVDTLSVPTPPATTVPLPPPPDTLPAGLAAVAENPVAGVTTTTAPAIGPGPASINGTVTGPNGPVTGATVQIDRFVGDVFSSSRTTSAADGTWSFRNILGGDYRVRAWQAPALDMEAPQVVFLSATHPQTVSLQLTSYQGQQVQVAINPANPLLNQPANLVIQVTDPHVDADGVLTAPPVVGTPVTLVNGSGWQVNNGNPLSTDTAGQATFEVECTAVGSDPLSAQVAGDPPVTLQMPPCGAPPPTTTTTTTTTTPGSSSGAPPTTCPPTTAPPGIGDTTTTSLAFGQQC